MPSGPELSVNQLQNDRVQSETSTQMEVDSSTTDATPTNVFEGLQLNQEADNEGSDGYEDSEDE